MSRRRRASADPVGNVACSSADRIFFSQIVDAVVAVGDYVRQEIVVGQDRFPSSRVYLASLVSAHRGDSLAEVAQRVRSTEEELLRCREEIRLLLVHQPQYATPLTAEAPDHASFCIYHQGWNRYPRTVARCAACPCVIQILDDGRPRQYCSGSCRTRAHRLRGAEPGRRIERSTRTRTQDAMYLAEMGIVVDEAYLAALRAFLKSLRSSGGYGRLAQRAT